MEIIKIHYKLSKPVLNYKEIETEAKEMEKFIKTGSFKGFYNKAFAICHCQVSETPYCFFVVSNEVIAEKLLKHKTIINPEIIEISQDKKIVSVFEACLSFPFRQEKKVDRYFKIKVKYQAPIKTLFGTKLKTIQEWKEGIIAQIFQHEIDHIKAKNIFFSNEIPVKWWELKK